MPLAHGVADVSGLGQQGGHQRHGGVQAGGLGHGIVSTCVDTEPDLSLMFDEASTHYTDTPNQVDSYNAFVAAYITCEY